MITRTHSLRNIICVVLVCTMVLTFSANLFAVAHVYLRADTTMMTMPDGRLIEMWGFAQDSDFEANDGIVSVPGPQLTIDPAEPNLIIHLENNLPESISIIIPGQTTPVVPGQTTPVTPVSFTDGQGRNRIQSFVHETPSGNTVAVDYEWTNLRPGTFLYQSGSHPAVQVQMGLYGCLKKDFADDIVKQAYDGIEYDNDIVLIFSEIDPALHDAVQANDYGPGMSMTSTIDYTPKYFLINGQAFTTLQAPLAIGQVNDKVLLRLVSASIESHVPFLQYLRGTVVAEDGFAYNYAPDLCAIDLPPAKTKDVIVVPAAAGTYPLYDHALGLTNDTALGGGMMVKLTVTEAAPAAPPTVRETVVPLDAGIKPFVALATILPADIDKNGSVNYKDVFLFIQYWHGMNVITEENLADLNGDGLLDNTDVTIMMEQLTNTPRNRNTPSVLQSESRRRARIR